MKILAIETSCDETAVSVLESKNDLPYPEFKVLGNTLLSQIETHRPYGGVFPALAKREHIKNIIPILASTLKQCEAGKIQTHKLSTEQKNIIEEILLREPDLFQNFVKFIESTPKPDIDHLSVTNGPGLEPALWVGISVAKALSVAWNLPLTPVNHLEGHIASVLLSKRPCRPIFPAIALLISGGHTELILVENWGKYKKIGATKDDAVGEAFDKVARMLELPYPGGPEISKLAKNARETGQESSFSFPRPMMHTPDLNFSFSGLKTAVMYEIKKIPVLTDKIKNEIALEFEDAVCEVLLHKTKKALEEFGAQSFISAGGVTANTHLREKLLSIDSEAVCIPETELSTDNAQMIAVAGAISILQNRNIPNIKDIVAQGVMPLDTSKV